MAAQTKRPGARRPGSTKGAVPMADSTAGLLLQEVRASIERIPATGEQLASRLRRDAEAWIVWSRRQAASALSVVEARFPAGLRQRGERVLGDLAAGRARLRTALEAQAMGLLARVLEPLNLVSRQDALALGGRLAEAERRLDTFTKER